MALFPEDSKRHRSIGFDFDLTVADTKHAIVSTLIQTFQVLKINPKLDIESNFDKLKSLKLKEQVHLLLEDVDNLLLIDQVIAQYMELYRVDGVKKTVLFHGVVELFEFLKHNKFKIHIVSAKSQKNLDYSVAFTQLVADEVIGNISGREKSYYLQKSGCTTYVGDARIDIEVARDAKCLSIILNPNINEIAAWEDAPDYHFESINDFYSWLRFSRNLELV